MLAQLAAPTSVEFAGWIACLATFAWLADRILRFYKDHLREQPPPAETYMRRDNCKEAHALLDARLGEVRKEFHALVQANHVEVADLKQSLTRIHERLDDLEARVGALPDRTLALILNSKSLFSRDRDRPL